MSAANIVVVPVLVALGILIGTVGTLVGLGGGFAVVPLLLWLFKVGDADRSFAAATSMAAVFLNACSGTFNYGRQRRIDYAAGIAVVVTASPAAVLGAAAVMSLGERTFIYDVVFAVVAVAMAATLVGGRLLARSRQRNRLQSSGFLVFDRSKQLADGSYLNYKLDVKRGMLTGALSGFMAGFLGIGGGIVKVPLMILFMRLPVHIATATSQFTLLFTTASATTFNVINGKILYDKAIPIGLGLIIGATIGARISKSVSGWFIRLLLAFILLLVAVRMLFLAS